MLNRLGFPSYDVAVIVTSPLVTHRLNRDYRGRDYVADVLSFPFHDEIAVPGVLPEPVSEEHANLGDILICGGPYLTEGTKWAVDDKVTHLVAHGLAHLTGHTHETDAKHERMLAQEIVLLQSAGLADATIGALLDNV
eukprot:g4469.t1